MKIKYRELPLLSEKYIKKHKYFMLFETSLYEEDDYLSYIFTDPLDVIRVYKFEDVPEAFRKIEEYSGECFLAGYFSYELGYYFEKGVFHAGNSFDFPLIYICVFDRGVIFDHKTGKITGNIPGLFHKDKKQGEYKISGLKYGISQKEYTKKIKKIKKYIERGDTYQVNFTSKFKFNFTGNEYAFYRDLKSRQNVSYGAFCKMNGEYVISLSPELFFRMSGGFIYSKPMKGTIKRGKNIEEDRERSLELKNSGKNRAENLMIVDLIRNDLGRVSMPGTVKTSKMFEIEKYNTLFQMTTLIAGKLQKDMRLDDIFKNIYPGGSVTGAPKIRTMEIIKELEKSERNIYCGALGFIQPDKKAVFNLPIRTVYLRGGIGEMGAGSGIVYDSDPAEEYKECVLKANFLINRFKPFKLLETILYSGKYLFIKEHLKRLKSSAMYFDNVFNETKIRGKLEEKIRFFKKGVKYRVRLLLHKNGTVETEHAPIASEPAEKTAYIAVSKKKTNSQNVFYYHKTTNRELYNTEYAICRKKGYYDIIFLNEKNEVTEGAVNNIILQTNDGFITPPVPCGLLPGIYREHFIKHNKVKEKPVFLKDLVKADKIFLCNSVRGLKEVKLKKK